jgi:hypothetical protein
MKVLLAKRFKLQLSPYCLEEHVRMTEDSHHFSGEEDDTTPAASPHVSEGPQKHAIVRATLLT